jgi:hypothetical protein
VAIVAPELVAFPALRQLDTGQMNTATGDIGAQHAYTAVNLYLLSLSSVAGSLFWLGLAFFGLAMLRDPASPRWLAQAGIAVGVVEIIAGFALGERWTVFKLLFVLGCLWLVVVGYSLSRMGRAPTPA